MGSPRRPRERKPQYLKDIERIFNPKTAEDMTFALTVPLSPVHKEFMNQLAQAAENEFIIEWLIEKFLIKEYKMREKEKEAIIRQMWMKDDAEKEKVSLHYRSMQKINEAREKLAIYTRVQLEQMEIKLQGDLKNISAALEMHQAALTGLTVKKNQNTKQYKIVVTNALKQNIQTHQIQLTIKKKDSNGNLKQSVIDKPLEVIKEVMAEMPAPVDIVMQVEKAYIEAGKAFDVAMAQTKSAVAFMPPPPPPPPPPKPTPAHFAKQNNVNLEFNLIKKIADSDAATDILTVIKDNKKSLNKLFCMDSDAKAEQCAIFDEALKVGGEMRNCVRQLDIAREMYSLKSQLLKQLLNDLLERKKQLDADEKAAPPTAGNSHN